MDEKKTTFDEELEQPKEEVVSNKPRPFLVWQVKDKEYKLKLTTSVITKLENQFEKPLMEAVLDDGIPAQNTIVSMIQGAMQKFQHGIKSMDVEEIIDDYIEDGHTMMDILKNVIYPLMYDAGFFTKAMMEEMFKAMNDLDTGL